MPYQWLEDSIQRHYYQNVIHLCETFPSMLQNYQQNSLTQPVHTALVVTERWDSFDKDKPIIKYLLERTSNLTHPALILLAGIRICDLDTIRYLLDRGAPLDSVFGGFTALAHAAFLYTTQRQKHTYNILKLLLERCADVNFLLDNKPDYLGNIHLMEMILQYTAFDPCKPHPKVSFFHNACITGSLRLVKLLVERYHVDIQSTFLAPPTPLIVVPIPLMVCVLHDSFEVIKYLLPRFKDPKVIESTIIHAIGAGKTKSVKLLLPYCPTFKKIQTLNAITVMAYDLKQLHVFIYLHSILQRTIDMR